MPVIFSFQSLKRTYQSLKRKIQPMAIPRAEPSNILFYKRPQQQVAGNLSQDYQGFRIIPCLLGRRNTEYRVTLRAISPTIHTFRDDTRDKHHFQAHIADSD